jgi:hypothetical protein
MIASLGKDTSAGADSVVVTPNQSNKAVLSAEIRFPRPSIGAIAKTADQYLPARNVNFFSIPPRIGENLQSNASSAIAAQRLTSPASRRIFANILISQWFCW